ncbi:dihydropteroate synthase [Silvimonas sp.]|uniref:dihydropteroate synthase n=1 Tax=Silvimonas sp. TaxID=2650811 RepID=UPI002846CA52|nr:dihydropteroate synthase [Silvimonas sp.]MDR3428049.1 dihydropteroate synthase [Silvimonas sp.]
MHSLQCGRFTLTLDRPQVMGILNVTPDSFSDGGSFDTCSKAVAHAETLVSQGADIIDIGGESTRPGAELVSIEDEIARVVPVIAALKSLNVPLSIDTRRPAVMLAALDAGVDLINDIAALEGEGALRVAAKGNVAVCLMHMKGEPRTMQVAPEYDDVVAEVTSYLATRRDEAEQAGIERSRILLDPGFGFGKNLAHNIALFNAMPQMREALGCPLLIGVSRKSMLGQITGRVVSDRMAASVAAALLAAQKGAAIVRVHDVRETVDALKIWQALQ